MRTLIGAIGYRNLRDHSAAFEVLERLAAEDLGPDVVLEDVSYNPIALVQWLDEQPPGARFERFILVSGIQRAGRRPGAVTSYAWDRTLPSDALIQQAITEAVTGIISLDNTVVIAGYFGALPRSVTIVEIEPIEHEFGFELSQPVAQAVAAAALLIRNLAREREALP
jgi:hydrogenase maturation protease